jgi:FAD-dependent sensor of blue light
MIHLIYVSRACPRFMVEELQALVAKSRASNVKRGITGMLLHKDGNVMQLLEGDEQAVLELYRRIAGDPRHCDVVILVNEPLAARQFADWFMGFTNLDEPGIVGRPGYRDYCCTPLTPEAFTDAPTRALNLMRVFQQPARGRSRMGQRMSAPRPIRRLSP